MKKIIIAAAVILFSAVSCDFLDTAPKSVINPDSYFNNETELQLFTNSFYNNLLDKSPYLDQSDHYVNGNGLSNLLRGGTNRITPTTGGSWTWGDLRKMNTLLEHIYRCDNEAVREKYTAITRYFRAFFYFDKVKRFGDVPWVDKELGDTDQILYNPRDSREFVLTKMLEDVDYAINTLDDHKESYRVTKWAALALKAEMCLYEGTLRKYHKLNIEGHDYTYYLDLAAQAAKQIMDSGQFHLAKDYLMLFAQEDADPNEYILSIAMAFSPKVRNNCNAFALVPTQGRPGLTKKFVDSFLMKDGSRFTDKEGYATMPFVEAMKNRDPRLGFCTRTPGYKRIGGNTVLSPDLGVACTGYQIVKWVMDETLPEVDRVDCSYNDIPVYRLGEIYLIYAEAKAELGQISQEDLDISINLLRDRVGMAHLNLAKANANPDPYLLASSSPETGYHNVEAGANQGIILEIRRERSVELAQEGYRWGDLMRWKEGLCVDQPMLGMYFPGPGRYDLTGDGKDDIWLYEDVKPTLTPEEKETVALFKIGEDITLSEGNSGYMDPHKNTPHLFNEERDYYYPIPLNDLLLNKSLVQNPGWNKPGESAGANSGSEESK